MKSFLKKVAAVAIVSATLLNFHPAKSNAIIGIATGSIIFDCLGIVVIAVGEEEAQNGNRHDGRAAAFMGLFILDSKTQMPSEYGKMTDEMASHFGLNAQTDHTAITEYNESLPKIQGIHSDIIVAASKNPTLKTDQDIQNFARAEWQQRAPHELSSGAWMVLQKIQN
jgi:hypothetical protein